MREFRTPLSAGLTLMFAVWVAVGDQLTGAGDPFDGFSDRVRDLNGSLGAASAGAVLAFIGYLVGAVLVTLEN